MNTSLWDTTSNVAFLTRGLLTFQAELPPERRARTLRDVVEDQQAQARQEQRAAAPRGAGGVHAEPAVRRAGCPGGRKTSLTAHLNAMFTFLEAPKHSSPKRRARLA